MHPAITRYTTLQDQAADCVRGLPTVRVVDWLHTEDACDAQRRGRRSAGGYLDKIGKTDLALLSAGEWTPPF
jgi:hypothetical protein